jgi:ribonuclease HIII
MVEPPLPAFPFDLAREARLRQVLDAYGYALREPPPPYARLEAAGEGVRLTLYASGKLLLQGKRAREVQGELAAFGLLDPLPAGAAAGAGGGAAAPPPPLIGSDETGKGDYFGPLVVAAAYVDPGSWAALRSLGVRDSKKVTDASVHKLAERVAQIAPHEIVSISPARYNELYEKFGSLNRLLAWAHARAIENLLARVPCERVLVDQFASDPGVVERALLERGRRVRLEQRPRAEEETAVAAASVLARAEFLKKLAELSDRSGIVLEKGASSRVVEAARRFVARHGKEKLREVAKLHFQSTAQVLGS